MKAILLTFRTHVKDIEKCAPTSRRYSKRFCLVFNFPLLIQICDIKHHARITRQDVRHRGCDDFIGSHSCRTPFLLKIRQESRVFLG